MQTTIIENKQESKLTADGLVNINFLYPYQKYIVGNPFPKQFYRKSRQIGFSMALANRAYLRGQNKRGFEVLYTSVGERQATEWLDKIRTLLILDNVEPIIDKNIMIKLPNGSRFIALPQNPSTTRSYSPDEIYLDEFAHWQKDKAMLTALAPSLTRKDKKRIMIIGSTCFGKQGEFHRIWEDDETFQKNTINLQTAISMGCPIDMDSCRGLVPDEVAFQQEYMCQFTEDAYSYFPYSLIKSRWNNDLTNWNEEDMRKCKNPLYAGYDPAKFQDSGVFIVTEKVDKKFITRHIREWKRISYTQQLEYIKKFMKEGKITMLRMDRTGVGEKLYEDLNAAFPSRVEGVTFTNSSKEKMIIDLRVLFQDALIEIPYNMNLSNQLHSLQKIVTESKNVRYTHKGGAHDDYVWALALAVSNLAQPKLISVRFLGE